jgi:hypothetical protein
MSCNDPNCACQNPPVMRMKGLVGSVRKLVNDVGNPTSEEIAIQAVVNDGGINKSWAKWTPYINYNFTVTNPQAWGKLKPGDFLFIDLTLTEPSS